MNWRIEIKSSLRKKSGETLDLVCPQHRPALAGCVSILYKYLEHFNPEFNSANRINVLRDTNKTCHATHCDS